MADITPDEDSAIITAFNATLQALSEILIALQQQLAASTNPQQQAQLQLQIAEVNAEIANTQQAFNDYLQGNLALVPPDDKELAAVVKNATEVAELTAQNLTASALLTLATHAADLLGAATS